MPCSDHCRQRLLFVLRVARSRIGIRSDPPPARELERGRYGFLVRMLLRGSTVFVADAIALTESERPILCVDLIDQPGRAFRCIPRQLWGVDNNLSLANIDFDEFATSVDADGVHRGFA